MSNSYLELKIRFIILFILHTGLNFTNILVQSVNMALFIYIRHAQHTARESFQFGPQSPNLPIFGLIFDGNIIKIGKNLTNLARKCVSNIFLARHEI